ncbi:MAG: dicarboxylate/amino acid:cation symporter [Lachnospiraceae bacterium]|jgi:proton glutamate symport protein|nr:dicarboxylate/amino acid:cation symporter [Lachnospiraceae bacterium]
MKKNKLAIAIFISLAASIVIGVLLQGQNEKAEIFLPLGTIYVNLIKMIMVPLVFSSLVVGISSITDMKKIGEMGVITIVYFMFTTALAVMIGLGLSNIFKPGTGVAIGNQIYEAKEFPSVTDSIVGIFPSNILEALLSANMLQIIFIAVVMGIAIVKIAPKGDRLRGIIEELFDVMSIITKGVMVLTPIGVLGLMIPTVAANGISVLVPLAKLILVFYLAVMIQIGVIYTVSLNCFADFRLKEFYKAMLPAQVIAFVSCSSAAALPVSMQRMQEKLKISKEVSSFVLPLGATINMDGNALYQGIVALFIAQAYGIEMTVSMQIMIVLTGTLASIGAAGIPGAGMIVLSTVLMSVGLPVDGIALVAGIDRILDMGRTLTNITGDAVTTCIVEKKLSKRNRKEA